MNHPLNPSEHLPILAAEHPHEAERLKALESYGLVGTVPEAHLDEIVALVAEICGSSSAMLTLVGADHLWFKSRYNFNAQSSEKAGSFCSHAILHEDVMVVKDTMQDERFAHNPIVVCPDTKIRFYAGAPLVTDDGLPIGVLCAMDTQPRSMTALQQRTLKILAKQIMAQMDLHKLVLESRKGLLSLNKDVEDLHQQNIKAVTVNNNKDKFIAIIAHDLKAAFHGLLGFSEILDTEFDELGSDSMRKIASYLNETSHSTYKLLENLLEWAMMENGAMSYRPKVIHLERTVDNIVTALHVSAEQKGIDIIQQVDKRSSVIADLNMLKSLLQNLISNAIKFSHPGTVIRIVSRLSGERVMVSITDEGIGMTQQQISNLFRVELNQSTRGTKGETGTGLGLILCQQFARQLGGELQVESVEGAGTTFSFSLQLH